MNNPIRQDEEHAHEDLESLPQPKGHDGHQSTMGTVQEWDVNAVLLRYVHWVRPYGVASLLSGGSPTVKRQHVITVSALSSLLSSSIYV